ncbi:MAG: iron chelate uptake ABC transporter family permease subunit [Anaerolineae bacterium]|nr:iron chelate uptake ABC transporter family permease subunit [Anaerolineae bacterium]
MLPEDRRVWQRIGVMALLMALGVPLSMALGVQYDYTLTNVALGGALLGILCGMTGTFAVLRRQSLIGDTLSHAALPGVVIAFMIFGRESAALLLGAALIGGLGVLMVNWLVSTTRLKQDAAMGVVLSAFFAVGVALLSYVQGRVGASQAGLEKFIFGQAAAIIERDVLVLSAACLLIGALLYAFWKEFKLLTFDPDFARATGLPIARLNAQLSGMIVVAIVLGLQLAGAILMVGLLIAPPVAARQWTRRLEQMIVLAMLFGAFSGGAGAVLSALERGLPTGPLIIVVACGIVLVSLLLAPQRGILWQLQRQRHKVSETP